MGRMARALLKEPTREQNAMWSMTKIMVPTDFSDSSERALEAAIVLARKFNASIVLLHVYQVPVYPYPAMTSANVPAGDLAEYVERGARAALETCASRHGDSGITITTVLKAGIPWEQILRTSKEIGAGLVVIGSRGLRGLPRALLGSTAERVVRFSSVPVMTFHGPLPVSEADKTAAGIRDADELVDRWLL
jgi:nucleotide-binding universal stress UspA family protein